MNTTTQERLGLTLIECLAVLIVLGLLAAMLMPAVCGAQSSSLATERHNQQRMHEYMHGKFATRVGNNYDQQQENNFLDPSIPGNDFSTFSIDVDTASYTDVRSQLTQYNMMPHPHSVRIEEMINYFDYAYTPPAQHSRDPFNCHIDSSVCPWNQEHRLLRIALKGKEIDHSERAASNLVFLIDSSGSMNHGNKMGLLRRSFKLLVNQLDERDSISIVTYAGSSGIALNACTGDQKGRIIRALDNLRAHGSTNGGSGIQLAYRLAQEQYIHNGNNRIILATDGDFNVGVTDRSQLLKLIKEKAKSNIFLSIHGYGMDNRQDGMLEEISNNGNGTYAFIDNINESHKVMVKDMLGSLICIAKDVKIQCAFNPDKVAAWRLIGYHNRILQEQDFKNDKKDAGDIGAGHNVTALYEIIPKGVGVPSDNSADPNPFVTETHREIASAQTSLDKAWLQIRLRYKDPKGHQSTERKQNVIIGASPFEHKDEHFRWSASVAAFGMLLKQSEHKGNANWPMVVNLAQQSRGLDKHGHRSECIQLMEMARDMQRTN